MTEGPLKFGLVKAASPGPEMMAGPKRILMNVIRDCQVTGDQPSPRPWKKDSQIMRPSAPPEKGGSLGGHGGDSKGARGGGVGKSLDE